jgi:hypothetical protein
MDYEQSVQELKAFFQGRSHFKEVNKYVGMAVSQIHRVFKLFFESLEPAERQIVARVIVAGTLGKEPGLIRYVARCQSLLHYLCIAGYIADFDASRADLEREFNDSANIARWINAKDSGMLRDDVTFKKDWHYALSLWSILFLLKSEQIDETYAYLHTHAHLQAFREALRSVKQSEEKRGGRSPSEWKIGEVF